MMRVAAWIAIVVVAAVAGVALGMRLPLSNRAEPYRAPRTADGAPDLSGVWQALNTANFDIQAHRGATGVGDRSRVARARSLRASCERRVSMCPLLPFARSAQSAAFRPEPAWSRATRSHIRTVGAREEEGERRQLARARSGNQVLHARRPARHLHAVSVSDPSGHEQDSDRVRIRRRDAHDSPGHRSATAPARAGWGGRAAAGRATRSSSR